MDEQVEITLTVTELQWLLDLTDQAVKQNELWKLKSHPILSVDNKLHVAYEGTEYWQSA